MCTGDVREALHRVALLVHCDYWTRVVRGIIPSGLQISRLLQARAYSDFISFFTRVGRLRDFYVAYNALVFPKRKGVTLLR